MHAGYKYLVNYLPPAVFTAESYFYGVIAEKSVCFDKMFIGSQRTNVWRVILLYIYHPIKFEIY